jgi:3-hydroxybutyryl-CoA dehydrogenase
MAREVRRVGVVGLGTMGSGIAQVCIEAGFDTVARETDPAQGEAGRGRIEHFLRRKVEKGTLDVSGCADALARLHVTSELSELADRDLVIEAVFEDLALKHRVLGELETVCADDAILATNTSALSVGAIADGLARPERVVGLHFFNPAPLLPLVEVVSAEKTATEVAGTAFAFAEALGRKPIRCRDTPGFVVNRVLIPLLNDTVRVLDEAGVSPEDIDRGLVYGANWPLGPCALLDLIGIDIHVHASEALHAALGEERMAPPARLVAMLDQGKLGRKTGEGFFRYE